jgi:CysZ protein
VSVITPSTSLQGLVSGLRLPVEGARLLLREKRLWSLALVSMALSVLAVGGALAVVLGNAGALWSWVTAWHPALEATRWFAWLWVGPALAILALLSALLFATLVGACLVAAYLVASLLASPFHDALAQRVEELETGGVEDFTASGVGGMLRDALRSMREEARRLLFFASVVGPLALAGFLLPGAHLLTGPLIAAFTIFFLPLDYAGYTLDRRCVPFRERRRWLRRHAEVVAGFGLAAFAICTIPGLNFVAMPLLVAGGTLLILRCPPPGPQAGTPSPR